MPLLSVCLLLYLGNQLQATAFLLVWKKKTNDPCVPEVNKKGNGKAREREQEKKREGEANAWFFWQIIRLGEWMRVHQAWTRICILLCIRTPTKAWSKIRWNWNCWQSFVSMKANIVNLIFTEYCRTTVIKPTHTHTSVWIFNLKHDRDLSLAEHCLN